MFKAKVIASIFIIIWVLILLLITINHSLSCVKPDGTVKKICQKELFRYSYRRLIN